jgi:hypothetical protein
VTLFAQRIVFAPVIALLWLAYVVVNFWPGEQ